MKDSRRDKTAAIPPATLAELKASREKLAKRSDTNPGSEWAERLSRAGIPSGRDYDAPRPLALAKHVVWQPPVEALTRDDVEASLRDELYPFDADCREAFCRKFEDRSYTAAVALVELAAKKQPGNVAMAMAASSIRSFATELAEGDAGGPRSVMRLLKPLSTVDAPVALEAMLRSIDSKSTTEQLITKARSNRLAAFDFIADLARSGHIEVLVPPAARTLPDDVPSARTLDAHLENAALHQMFEQEARVRSSSYPPPSSSPPSNRQVTERGLGIGELAFAPLPLEVAQPFTAAAAQPPAAPEAEVPSASLLAAPDVVEEPVQAPWQHPPPDPLRSRSSRPSDTVLVGPPIAATRATPRHTAVSQTARRTPYGTYAAVAFVLTAGALLAVLLVTRSPASTDGAAGSALPAERPHATDPTTAPKVVVPPLPSATTAPTSQVRLESIQLKVSVEPKYARVFLDGVLLTPPISLSVVKDLKVHEVRIEADGFHAKKATFTADADATLIISLDQVVRRNREAAPSVSAR